MRTFIIFILSCASVFGGDAGVQVVTTVKTNAETGNILTTDVCTRNGQTNLVRFTSTKAGVAQIRIETFYHSGVFVGRYIAAKDLTYFKAEAGIPYSLSFEFGRSNELRSAIVETKDSIADIFCFTNGVFYPAEAIRIQEDNDAFRAIDDAGQARTGAEVIKKMEEAATKIKEKYPNTIP
jgi:hypothetical protein